MAGTRNFLGEFHYTVDVKGRVNLPARFRNARPEETEFVVTLGIDPCLYVVPSTEWLKFERSLEEISTLVRSHRTFLRDQTRYATPPTHFDKQGRILIPKNLLQSSKYNFTFLNLFSPNIFVGKYTFIVTLGFSIFKLLILSPQSLLHFSLPFKKLLTFYLSIK